MQTLTTQQKFTAALQRIADERGLDLVSDGAYANVGTFSFQLPEGFESILSFPFDFQRNRASFVPVIGGKEPGPLGARNEEDGSGFSGVEGEDFNLVVTRVAEILNGSGCAPGMLTAATPAEEALTQCQHIAYDGLVQLERDDVNAANRLKKATTMLERINSIAEACEPTPEFRAMLRKAREEDA